MIGQLAVLGLAIICLLTAVYFVGKSIAGRGRVIRAAYNMQRHEARRAVKLNLIWGGAAFVVGVLLLLTSGVAAVTTGVNPLVLPTATATQTSVPTATIPPTATPLFVFTVTPAGQPAEEVAPTPAPDQTVATPAPDLPAESTTPIPTPTATPTAGPVTAIVTSGVGVWVRAEPTTAGAQIERALTNSLLVVLDGQETADGFVWQRVQTTSGNEGWVATEFIEIQNP